MTDNIILFTTHVSCKKKFAVTIDDDSDCLVAGINNIYISATLTSHNILHVPKLKV